MENKKYIPVVTTFCVTLTILFFKLFSNYIEPKITGTPGLGFVVGILTSVGFYVSLFQIMVWFYFKFLFELINPQEAITGEWFYKLSINGKDNEPRYGICLIKRHWNELSITGIHFCPAKNKFTSRFNSSTCLFDKNELIILYTSVGVDEETFLRRGSTY